MCHEGFPSLKGPDMAPEEHGTLPMPGGPTPKERPTKFGNFVNFMVPLAMHSLQGGAAAAGGTDGFFGGMRAAQNADLQRQVTMGKMQSEKAQAAYDAARAKREASIPPYLTGSQTTYTHNDENDTRHRYKMNPNTGEELDLGADPFQEQYTQTPTDAGIMAFDKHRGQMTPVTNMAPEQTGSMPLPGQTSTVPLEPYAKAQAPFKLSEGQQAFDSTGKLIASVQPKVPKAPQTPKSKTARVPGQQAARSADIENTAAKILGSVGGDPDKAIAWMNAQKDSPPDAAKIRAAIRDRARTSTKKRARPPVPLQ